MSTRFLRTATVSAAVIGALSLGACGSLSPQAKSAAIGATAGAVAGSVITGTTSGAAIGAAIGGVIGNEEGKKREGR